MNKEPESGFKTWKAHAKINLTLEVTGKRDDGYHQIVSVMQAISLDDSLSFQPGNGLYLECNIAALVSPNNLVYRAATLLQDFAGKSSGAAISIDKNIPLASGLGGGSSNAAATLQALNEVWELNLAPDKLRTLAAKLGSDTVFFIDGGTVLAEGRGEKITSLPSLPETWVVLVKPPVNIPNKTSSMYAGLSPSDFTGGEATQRVVGMLNRGERITSETCYNVFERVAFSRFAELEEYRKRFISAGAGKVHLAGSGPTLFTLAENESQGKEICHQLEREGMEVYLARTL